MHRSAPTLEESDGNFATMHRAPAVGAPVVEDPISSTVDLYMRSVFPFVVLFSGAACLLTL